MGVRSRVLRILDEMGHDAVPSEAVAARLKSTLLATVGDEDAVVGQLIAVIRDDLEAGSRADAGWMLFVGVFLCGLVCLLFSGSIEGAPLRHIAQYLSVAVIALFSIVGFVGYFFEDRMPVGRGSLSRQSRKSRALRAIVLFDSKAMIPILLSSYRLLPGDGPICKLTQLLAACKEEDAALFDDQRLGKLTYLISYLYRWDRFDLTDFLRSLLLALSCVGKKEHLRTLQTLAARDPSSAFQSDVREAIETVTPGWKRRLDSRSASTTLLRTGTETLGLLRPAGQARAGAEDAQDLVRPAGD